MEAETIMPDDQTEREHGHGEESGTMDRVLSDAMTLSWFPISEV